MVSWRNTQHFLPLPCRFSYPQNISFIFLGDTSLFVFILLSKVFYIFFTYCNHYQIKYSMFPDVPECSGMFQVPSFINAPAAHGICETSGAVQLNGFYGKIFYFYLFSQSATSPVYLFVSFFRPSTWFIILFFRTKNFSGLVWTSLIKLRDSWQVVDWCKG